MIENIETREKVATVEDIAARHQPTTITNMEWKKVEVCRWCRSNWPCDSSLLLAQLKDREEKLAAIRAWRKATKPPNIAWSILDSILKGGE